MTSKKSTGLVSAARHNVAVGNANVLGRSISTSKISNAASHALVPNSGWDEVSDSDPTVPAYWGTKFGEGDPNYWAKISLDPTNVYSQSGNALRIENVSWDQLIPNGEFETDISGWTATNCSSVYHLSEPASPAWMIATGTGAMHLASSATGGDMHVSTSPGTAGVPVTPNAPYTFSALGQADSDSVSHNCQLTLSWYDAQGTLIRSDDSDPLSESSPPVNSPGKSYTASTVACLTAEVVTMTLTEPHTYVVGDTVHVDIEDYSDLGGDWVLTAVTSTTLSWYLQYKDPFAAVPVIGSVTRAVIPQGPNFSAISMQAVSPSNAAFASVSYAVIGTADNPVGNYEVHYLDHARLWMNETACLMSDAVPVVPGDWLLYTFWAKASAATTTTLKALMTFHPDTPLFTPDSVGASSVDPWALKGAQGFSTGWTKYSGRVQVPSTAKWMRAILGTQPGTRFGSYDAWFDDGAITDVSTGNIQSFDFSLGSSGWALSDDGTGSQVQDTVLMGVTSASDVNVHGTINQVSQATYTDDNGVEHDNTLSSGDWSGPAIPGLTADWADLDTATVRNLFVGGSDPTGADDKTQPLSEYVNDQGFSKLITLATSATGVNTAEVSSTTVSLFTSNLGTLIGGNVYRITFNGVAVGTVADDDFHFTIRYTSATAPTAAATPTTSSAQLSNADVTYTIPTPVHTQGFTVSSVFSFPVDTNVRILLTAIRQAGTGTMHVDQGSTTPLTMTLESVGTTANTNGVLSQLSVASGSPGSTSPPPPATTKITRVKSFSSRWTQSYDADKTPRGTSTDDSGNLYQGYFSSAHGNTRSACGFGTSILLDLAGVPYEDILKVSLSFKCLQAYLPTGMHVVIGGHKSTSNIRPLLMPSIPYSITSKTGVRTGGSYTVDLPLWVGGALAAGTLGGFAFGPGWSNDSSFFGILYGWTGAPRVTITYRK